MAISTSIFGRSQNVSSTDPDGFSVSRYGQVAPSVPMLRRIVYVCFKCCTCYLDSCSYTNITHWLPKPVFVGLGYPNDSALYLTTEKIIDNNLGLIREVGDFIRFQSKDPMAKLRTLRKATVGS